MKATYTYLADGTKIKAVNASGWGSDYVGSFKYSRNGSNITLESVATAGGRTYKTSGGYEARYFISDHLGSTRLIAYPNGSVIEQNDYMPYGERHANSSLATSGNPFLYNGKESQKSFGINYIDSEARFQRLDGAFNSIDPLCEKYYHISPYTYCASNPINNIDPDGNIIWIHYFNKNGDLQKLKYEVNMQYDGSIDFVNTVIGYINTIYTNGGNKALDVLINSNNCYNVANTSPATPDTFQFQENELGGGTIKAGALMNHFEQSQGIESLAHELFHGLQHELNQGGTSIYNEVEAYAFGYIIMDNWKYSDNYLGSPESFTPAGLNNKYGIAYTNAFISLTTQFSEKSFIEAVNNFKFGSMKNESGLYNKYPLHRKQTLSLLNRYYPR